jgi:murein L,D-transpeptidase YcbB/YkuD
MRRTEFPVLAVVACLVFAGAMPLAAPGQSLDPPATTTPMMSADPLATALAQRLAQVDDGGGAVKVRGERIVLIAPIARYYQSEQYQPRWQNADRLATLLASLRGLYDDGLDVADYHVTALESFGTELRAAGKLPLDTAVELELLATDALLLGLSHLYLGKVDPARLSQQWNYPSRPVDRERAFVELTRALESGRIREAFAAARPQHVWYTRGLERLADYRAITAAGGWPTVPEGPALKPGNTDPRVPTLRARLRVTGDLAATPEPTIGEEQVYDTVLEQAVQHFQERHGLTADGVVGPATLKALNVPVEQRIDQIRVNLERSRWVLHEIKGEFVLVDVAGFYVSYFRDDEPVWTSKVIVGRPYRETPIFKADITHVVFNPTWTIPPGILAKDKLPVIKRDPGYLARSHIRVIDSSGRQVDPYSVEWSRYSASRLPPYQFVQDPGEDNALGLVKIMFPNPYLVYLHDTPSKSLFERDERTFSSGCIRVQKPFELAELVLHDPVRWNAASIETAKASGKTQTVHLEKSLPVLLLYWTAQPRSDGQVIFRNDVYGRDPPTLAALDRPLR